MRRQYENLITWQEAHQLCLAIYKLTSQFPSDEKFCLVSQMRRASYSISTNIAEGNGRRSKKEKAHFCDIATGSTEELHYQCTLTKDLGYISQAQFDSIDDSIQRTGYLVQQLRRSLL